MSEVEVKGLKELEAKLVAMGAELGGRTLKAAVTQAMTPVLREMRAAAPVGKRAHKTYRGRLVAPGFLKQSIVKKTHRMRHGVASVDLGVKDEAFYGVQYLDEQAKSPTRKYKPRFWFKRVFIRNRAAMERRLADVLKKKIEKIARR